MASPHFRINSGGKGSAAEHAAYISRRGRFGVRGDLIDCESGNLPDWSGGDPVVFFREADKNERRNGATYREVVFALPVELGRHEQRKIVCRFVAEVIGTRPFFWAIHAPDAALGDCANVHVHVMYSDRLPDGIARSPDRTFRRFNPNDPASGGCRKASGGREPIQLRDELIAMRQKCATIQNDVLEENGKTTRVDYRSLEAQGIMRAPERRLGPAGVKHLSVEARSALISERSARRSESGPN